MKCPYRIVKKIYKNIKELAYEMRHDEIRHSFPDCYGKDCPLYINGECIRAASEKGEVYFTHE